MRGNGWEIQKVVGSYRAKNKASKVLWGILVAVILALMVALVILFHIPLLREYPEYRYIMTLLFALAGIAFYLAYGRRYYEAHRKQSRVVFVVCFSLASGFMIVGMVGVLFGRPLPPLHSFLLFLVLIAVGAYLGDKLGRKLGLY